MAKSHLAFCLAKNGNTKKQAQCNARPKQLRRLNLRKLESASLRFDDTSNYAIIKVITSMNRCIHMVFDNYVSTVIDEYNIHFDIYYRKNGEFGH